MHITIQTEVIYRKIVRDFECAHGEGSDCFSRRSIFLSTRTIRMLYKVEPFYFFRKEGRLSARPFPKTPCQGTGNLNLPLILDKSSAEQKTMAPLPVPSQPSLRYTLGPIGIPGT